MAVRESSNFLTVNTIYSVVLKLVRITRFFMLVPYKQAKNHQLVLSIPRLIFSIFSVFLILYGGIHLITHINHFGYIKENPHMLLGLARVMCHYIYMAGSSVYVCFKHKKILKVLNKIRDLDEALSMSRRKFKKFVVMSVLLTGYSYVVSVFYNMLFYTVSSELTKLVPVIGVSVVVPETTHVYFMTFVLIIGFYIDSIRSKLKEGGSKVYALEPKPETIEKLRVLYGEINDMKEDVNDIYSLHLLLMMAAVFIDMVFKFFLHIVIFKYGNPDFDILPKLKYVQIFLGTSIRSLKTIAMILVCHWAAEKGKGIGVDVHDLMGKVKDENVRQELTIFSLELHHRDPYISAAGFFNLDCTLLYEITGAITMYIINHHSPTV